MSLYTHETSEKCVRGMCSNVLEIVTEQQGEYKQQNYKVGHISAVLNMNYLHLMKI